MVVRERERERERERRGLSSSRQYCWFSSEVETATEPHDRCALCAIWGPHCADAKLNCFTRELQDSIFLFRGFCILLRVLHQGYWKNRPSLQLFNEVIYIYFTAPCFDLRWSSSCGIHNYFREITSLQRIRCFVL
jgi:hypothetical protein